MGTTPAITLIDTFGVAACLGGSQDTGYNAPHVIRSSPFQHHLTEKNLALHWKKIVAPVNAIENSLNCLSKISQEIASLTYKHTIEHFTEDTINRPFLLISGDHSSAIGTWSGVIQALARSSALHHSGLKTPNSKLKTLGLIWLDAHLDAHTLETSPSGNLHGMPLSVLLNKADKELQATYPNFSMNQATDNKYLLGKNLSLLGVRSYEPEEHALLKQANANIYDMDKFHKNSTPAQLLNIIAKDLLTRCDAIGISLDLDAISPEDAPAVETPEKNGIPGEMLIFMLDNFSYQDKLIGFEISEFNPVNDINQKTEKLIMQLIAATFNK